jgi:hypothetical protein
VQHSRIHPRPASVAHVDGLGGWDVSQQLKRQVQSAQDKVARQQRQQTLRREAFEARTRQLRQEHGLLAR